MAPVFLLGSHTLNKKDTDTYPNQNSQRLWCTMVWLSPVPLPLTPSGSFRLGAEEQAIATQ